MSFWLRESKFVFVLRTIPRWCRVCLSVSALLVVGGTWYVWWHLPLQQKCVQTSSVIQTLAQRNDFLTKIIQQKPMLEQSKFALEQKLHNLAADSKFDDQAIVETLLTLLKKHDVSCKELKPLPIKCGEFWQKHSFSLTVKGHFKNIKYFMLDFFSHQKFVTCNNLSLVRLKKHKVKGDMKVTFITFGAYENKQNEAAL